MEVVFRLHHEEHVKSMAKSAEIAIEVTGQLLKDFPVEVAKAKAIVDLTKIYQELHKHDDKKVKDGMSLGELMKQRLGEKITSDAAEKAKELLEKESSIRAEMEQDLAMWQSIAKQIKEQVLEHV